MPPFAPYVPREAILHPHLIHSPCSPPKPDQQPSQCSADRDGGADAAADDEAALEAALVTVLPGLVHDAERNYILAPPAFCFVFDLF